MGTKDYYVILGVSHDENTGGIRKAYLDLAKRHHPDRSGPQGTKEFQDIAEAYEVLSNPEKRRAYNKDMHFDREHPEGEQFGRAGRGQPFPEPLIPGRVSLMRDFQTIRPSFDEMFERIFRNFTGRGMSKSEKVEALTVEIVLTPEEATRGGSFPLAVPVFHPCPVCGGSGRDWLFSCLNCEGGGMIEDERTIRIRIPPQVRAGTVYEVPLEGLGVHNLILRLYVRIGRDF